MNDHGSTTTTDHDTIRQWAEAGAGRPARLADTGDEGGIPRIDFKEPEVRLPVPGGNGGRQGEPLQQVRRAGVRR